MIDILWLSNRRLSSPSRAGRSFCSKYVSCSALVFAQFYPKQADQVEKNALSALQGSGNLGDDRGIGAELTT